MEECVTYKKNWSHEVQIVKEQVEYSLDVCVFGDIKCSIMLYLNV